ncbi:MAG: glycosyltransferase involved in cell wall biosynthesis [Loktanella salsilacus]|jgi:glycosyltransferase involved in cell wall biosynthesis|uniref:glycosyltransferase family 2 protein n=1 Tax=Loktanella salsilacus TaxID=195913 RepID=UPI003989DC66
MFSVVITTHNRQNEVAHAVASAARQSVRPDEIIVVDDASEPPLQEASLAQTAEGVPLRLIRHIQARGPSGARNAGIQAATAPWIAFLDDDDIFVPTKLQRCAEMFRTSAGADVIFHAAVINMINEGASYTTRLARSHHEADFYRRLLVRNVVGGTPMVAVRRQLLLDLGGFDEKLAALEDYELWLRLARAGARFLAIDEALTHCSYVTRKHSVTKSDAAGEETFSCIRERYQDDFNTLSMAEKHEHERWIREIELHRSLLRLDRKQTIRVASELLRKSPGPKNLLIFLLSFLGPRRILLLRAKL